MHKCIIINIYFFLIPCVNYINKGKKKILNSFALTYYFLIIIKLIIYLILFIHKVHTFFTVLSKIFYSLNIKVMQ